MNNLNPFLHWRRYLILLCMFIPSIFAANISYAGQLTASVDRDNIGVQETFTLTVSADSRVSEKPDFGLLKNDFEILSNNESQFTSISNNGAEFKKVWQLTLAPKRAGTLLIPSFTVEQAISDAIEIKVTKQSPTQATGDEPVHVLMDVTKKDTFVQEQILVKIQIVSKVNLNQTELQPLAIDNAVVIALDEKPKRFINTINGVQHLIEEQNFAIFPQQSGELVIPSLIYSVVPAVERDLWNDPFGRSRSNILRLPTEEQHINVRPIPAEAAGKSWLPATNLTLNETWSASLDHLKMGEPVTRTITISAEGLTGGQISPLPINVADGLTFYPDQPQNSDIKTTKGIQGKRVETIAIIPNHGGEFTLPEINIEWWDVNAQVMKTATLPAKKINVLGDAAPVVTPTPSTNASALTPEQQATTNTVVVNKINPWLWASTIAFALLSLVLIVYILHLKSRLKTVQNERDDLNNLANEKEKHIWDLLKHAASSRDAAALRKNVLAWAKFHWPEASIHSLDDIAKLAGRAELTQSLKELDALLYSNHPSDSWEPNQLLNLLNECRKEKNNRKKSEGLKPLYNN
jgi:hypothetical protein